ncbi:LOW QUALITY PROTEIN: hypothetical protein V2J09_022258 [Rumex salicifolius]
MGTRLPIKAWLNSRKAMLCLAAMAMAMSLAAATATAQAINRACPGNCGSVLIPYPFGMQEGCYLNEDFKISCQSEIPFLVGSDPQMKVQNISIDTHEITVYTPVASACYDNLGRSNTINILSVSSSKFPFSKTRNKFTAIGCDTIGLFVGDGYFLTGCFSFCNDSTSVDNSSCSGAGVNTNMTSGLHGYNISASSIFNHSDSWKFSPCDYAFFGDDSFEFQGMKAFQEPGDQRKNVPTVLDWAIMDHNCSVAKNSITPPYACKGDHTTCVDSQKGVAYYCQCSPGFQGNPYIINGCQDICKHRTCKSRVIKLAISAALLIALITGVIVVWRYVSKKRTEERRERYFRQNGGLNAFKVFRAEEMEEVTNNFDEDRIVGRGGFGVVYKGYLSDGREVAIKKSKSVDKYEIDQLVNEVVLLSKIQHQNVVGFYGCCLETPEPLLVYEFITNGTLLDHFQQLGSTMGNPPQNSSTNSWMSDFGISKLAPQNKPELYTKVKSTLGYLDPKFIQSSQLTDKSDVYSFGVVLLEMLTGERVLSFDRPERNRTLVMYFKYLVDEGSLLGILDRRIANQENVEELKVVAKIAGRCVSVKAEERPTMKEVAMEVGSLWIQVKNRCNASGVDVEYRSSGHPIGNAAVLHDI